MLGLELDGEEVVFGVGEGVDGVDHFEALVDFGHLSVGGDTEE